MHEKARDCREDLCAPHRRDQVHSFRGLGWSHMHLGGWKCRRDRHTTAAGSRNRKGACQCPACDWATTIRVCIRHGSLARHFSLTRSADTAEYGLLRTGYDAFIHVKLACPAGRTRLGRGPYAYTILLTLLFNQALVKPCFSSHHFSRSFKHLLQTSLRSDAQYAAGYRCGRIRGPAVLVGGRGITLDSSSATAHRQKPISEYMALKCKGRTMERVADVLVWRTSRALSHGQSLRGEASISFAGQATGLTRHS